MYGVMLWFSCVHEPIPLPPPPKPVQLTSTKTDYRLSRTHILKGWFHAHRNEWEQSRASFLLAIEANPESPWAYIEHGNAEYEYGYIEEARAAWRNAKSNVLPTQVELHVLLNNKIELSDP